MVFNLDSRCQREYLLESALLRSPADDHSKAVFDKSIRGHTDQFIYKFVKPLR